MNFSSPCSPHSSGFNTGTDFRCVEIMKLLLVHFPGTFGYFLHLSYEYFPQYVVPGARTRVKDRTQMKDETGSMPKRDLYIPSVSE
jgi:hypothetical protein